MGETTTILIKKATLARLNKLGTTADSKDSVINKLIHVYTQVEEKKQWERLKAKKEFFE